MNDKKTSVDATVWLPIPPVEAFVLVTRPDRLRRWLMVAGRIDLRVGGDVHLVVAPGAHAVGRVTEIEPGRRFSYTHGWVGDEEVPVGSTQVIVLLEPVQDGTSVTVRHQGLPQSAADGMEAGWEDFMRRLAHSATGESNKRDWPVEQELTTPAAVLDSALFTLLTVLRDLTNSDRSLQTPCQDFTVQNLATHLIDNAAMLGQALACAPVGEPAIADLEDDVATALWPTIEAAQALPTSTEIDLDGAPIAAEYLVKYLSVEILVHAWDIAQATGKDLDASTELIETVLGHAEQTRKTVFFTPQTFSPTIPTPADADPLTRLLALTGRSADSGLHRS